jgi:thiosulfate dehydrogenase
MMGKPYLGKSALAAAVVLGIAAGVAAGYVVWGRTPDWFAARDLRALPPGAATDLIAYGEKLITETPRHIGPEATDAAMRYAGNNLACANCHMRAGLQAYAAPLVSTFTSYPLLVDDRVITLTDRINGCMTRSMNGRSLPADGREMQAFIAYIEFLGRDTPAGIRVPGMGLAGLAAPPEVASAARGAPVYAAMCARCHGADGQGRYRDADAVDGFEFPPLWGDGSFNDAAGMSTPRMAAGFIHANMPLGVADGAQALSLQTAWDVAAFVTAQKRPRGPAHTDRSSASP